MDPPPTKRHRGARTVEHAAAAAERETSFGARDTSRALAEHRAEIVLLDILGSWAEADFAELHARMETATSELPDTSIIELLLREAAAIQNERL